MAVHGVKKTADAGGELYPSTDPTARVPKDRMAEDEWDPRRAHRLVRDELLVEGNARLNLATFCQTWVEPEVVALAAETYDKNMIDKDEYPQTAEIERRCVNIIGGLWNAPAAIDADPTTLPVGTSTTGSSEACMLGGMALKRRWQARRTAAGEPADRPNIVMGTNVQVCWHKFARYWDVDQRLVPVEGERYALNAEEAAKACDENTIGVVGVLGSTFTGEYEPIAEISEGLDDLQARTGLDVPIHVDAASGGFVAPFIQPDLVWDFRLPRVKSINASGHKYGLAPLGVGWVVWREAADLPEELVFHVNYLGGDMPVFAINFSRPGSQVIAQYYNFVRLGRSGYRRIQQNAQAVALHLADEIEAMGPFRMLTRGTDLPVLSWTMEDGANFTVFELSDALRSFGWQVPAYTMPANLTDMAICRIVVRHGLRMDLADLFLDDMRTVVDRFAADPDRRPDITAPAGFSHA
jgi:glutamate decarboxylase